MKKIPILIYILTLLPAMLYASIDVEYKIDLQDLYNTNIDSFRGEIIVNSTADSEIQLYIKDFYDIYINNKRLLTKSDIALVKISENIPSTITYRKKILPTDRTYDTFFSLYRIAPDIIDQNSINYTFKPILPDKFIGIMSSDKTLNNTFYLTKPLLGIDNINIIASSEFIVNEVIDNNTTIATYLFQKDSKLTDDYINSTKEYINHYKQLFDTNLPYDRFATVEVKSPVGYAVPSYTAIGESIINLPFIREISLMHEVLHQWFGVAIATDPDENWSEAITTYYADYYYNKEQGTEKKYRKKILDNYMTYVDISNNDNALINFKQNISKKDQTIGYGKGAFLFHMIEEDIGQSRFNTSISTFIKEYLYKSATWQNIIDTFGDSENIRSLSNFMLFSTKMIELKDFSSIATIKNGEYYININFIRSNGPNEIDLNYYVVSDNITTNGQAVSKLGKNQFRIKVPSLYAKIYFDQNYDIFRYLTPKEIPITISKFINSKNIIAIADNNECADLIKSLDIKKVYTSKDVKFSDLTTNSLLICSSNNSIARSMFANSIPAIDDTDLSSYAIYKNILSEDLKSYIMIANNPQPENIRLIKHYDDAVSLKFNGRKQIDKIIDKTQNGILVYNKSSDTVIKSIGTLTDIINEAENHQVIFIGETHTTYSHHLNQLEIIKAIYSRNKDIAVGFEMIQQQYQPILDKYVTNKIDEKTFLKDTNFFKKWGFDYNLYSPIFKFINKNQIPAIALNIDNTIIRRVSRGNYDKITPKEKLYIPDNMSIYNLKHYNEIKQIFDLHTMTMGKKLKYANFFLSQNIWDEVMAKRIYDYAQANPNTKIIVLIGGMHAKKDSGIPYRYKRLSGDSGFTILQDEMLDSTIADAIIITEDITILPTPKLGIGLKENLKTGTVTVTYIDPNSDARRAGIKNGDIIVDCDRLKIKDIFSLQYLVMNKDYNDYFSCTVNRKGNLIDIPIVFREPNIDN